MDAPSDADLLIQVGAGDAGAFPACVDRFGPLVWTLARRLLAQRSEAEDAVQEVFMEIWRCADRFDPSVASARAFVATIARRRLIDHGRSSRRHHRPGMPAEVAVAPADDSPLERSAKSEAEHAALAGLARLRPEQQKVLRLAIGESWTHERIATHLGLPVGTVKTHLRRGLLRLREDLREALGIGDFARGGSDA
jgi:RNA polymerase sigma-70 factor (ECF subfamily)